MHQLVAAGGKSIEDEYRKQKTGISSYFYNLDRFEIMEGYPDTITYIINATSIKPVEFFI